MKGAFLSLLLCLSLTLFGQNNPLQSTEIEINKWVEGTLLTPNSNSKPDLVIIIAGSGPTDRNGNQNTLKNNSLKKLAIALAESQIASFRYDKRTVKQIQMGKLEKKISFDDFVDDAKACIDHFKDNPNFSKIYIIGHSQGSLVGILAAEDNADGFISLAGAGQNIGDVLIEQVNKTAPYFTEATTAVVEKLKEGKTTKEYPKELSNMFNEELQKFMISWMQYNPTEEIKSLEMPVLIINGTKDLQVSVDEANLLAAANSKAELKIIENMNHVLFEIEGSDLENSKSYNEAFRPISSELIKSIVTFIESNR
ncbi:alpha/beta hydrolase [Winogradskyella sp. A3E31]|uniref:alpha/beta hydrolase n=1 Tax=Winogradskyella sp. A3E31 TaxID=3349637 RepID=UPI00398B240B